MELALEECEEDIGGEPVGWDVLSEAVEWETSERGVRREATGLVKPGGA